MRGAVTWSVLFLAACIAAFGLAATSPRAQDTGGIQLGDSVTMPTKAVNAGIASSVAFYIPEKDLLPESVAYDPKDGAFYVGSMRKGKIVRVDAKGNASDFIAARQDGLAEVLGVKVHPTRRVLWVCSYDGGELEGNAKNHAGAGGVFAFNLDTGKLIRKWAGGGCNDIALTRGNDAFVTSTPAVYRITGDSQTLERFMEGVTLDGANGITLSPDEKTLFVACNKGVQAIDIATRTGRLLTAAGDEPMDGIDGLYYFGDSLIGIRGNSVTRYHFGEGGRIDLTEVLEQNHPLMRSPTTGVIVENAFYYVANANFDAVQPDGSLAAGALVEPAILKLPLR